MGEQHLEVGNPKIFLGSGWPVVGAPWMGKQSHNPVETFEPYD
jgi:hypothetical protein